MKRGTGDFTPSRCRIHLSAYFHALALTCTKKCTSNMINQYYNRISDIKKYKYRNGIMNRWRNVSVTFFWDKSRWIFFSSLAARGYTHFIKTNVGFLTHLGGMLVDNSVVWHWPCGHTQPMSAPDGKCKCTIGSPYTPKLQARIAHWLLQKHVG